MSPEEFPELTDRERLTLLDHVLRSLVTPDGSYRTLADFIADMGVPIYDLLSTAEPLSTPHYSRFDLERLLALLTLNDRPGVRPV